MALDIQTIMTEALSDTLELLAHLEAQADRQDQNLMEFYEPYPKQADFHDAGGKFSERCFMAANQSGKSVAGTMEDAYHATGLYPDDWDGLRFDKPTVGWVCGVTAKDVRDVTQRLLVGRMEIPASIGTGAIPKECIINLRKAVGVPNALDHIAVKHISGGTSLIFFKSYADGREKFQGETIDWIHFDEEPPQDIYSEGLTRTNNGQQGQNSWLTYTPLFGMSDVTYGFIMEPSKYQIVINMTIDDALHYTPEQREQIIASYAAHEVDARARGIPILGSGRIFPVSDKLLEEERLLKIQPYWPQIIGIDFGWDHPFAAVHIAWDTDYDRVHILNIFREREIDAIHAAHFVKQWGDWIPVAWPHDGKQHEKGSGYQLAQQYADAGLNMLSEHATHAAGGNGVAAGLSQMLEMMQTGKMKVGVDLTEWWQEFHMYHRKDGKVVALKDDLLSATRYAIMMLRYAETEPTEEEEYEEDERSSSSALGWS